MNKLVSLQIKYRWFIGFLVFGIIIGVGAAAPHAALADPQSPYAGPSVYMPAAYREACTILKSPGLGGFQVYGEPAFGGPYHTDLLASGASWVRSGFSWQSVEPANTTPDKYQWANVDQNVQLAAQQCWPIVLLMEGNTAWASTEEQGPIDKVSVDELAQMMRAIAERYDGDGNNDAPGSPEVLYFEMYNEPDAGAVGATARWGEYGDQYAAMLKAVYPAIKSASPKAKVVIGGLSYDFFTDAQDPGPFVRSFLEDVLKNGGGAYFDIMNFHFYPPFGWNWTKQFPMDGPGLVEKTEAIRAVLRKYSVDKPIIVTETAWHNNAATPNGSNTLQTRMVQQLYTQAKVAGIPMVAWWPLADAGGSYEFDTGLVTNADSGAVTRKRAYTAFQVFMRELGNAQYRIQAPGDVDVKVYQFMDDAKNRTIYVAWTNPTDLGKLWVEDTARTVKYKLIGASAVVYDYAWTEVAKVSDADDGKRDGLVTVTINGDPKYIVIGG
jgi:hypothetical protein